MSAGTLYIAVKGDTKELVTALKSAQSMSVKFGKDAKKDFDLVGSSVNMLKTQVMALGSAWLGTQGIGAVIKIADQYSLLDSKLKLVATDSQDFAKIYEELYKISQNTGTSFVTNASAYANLGVVLRGTGIDSTKLISIFDTMTKSLVVAGASTQETESFMLQFKQALGSGRLAGQEFNAVMESNSYFGGLLAKTLGVNVGQLKEMAAEGKITTDVLMDAFPEIAGQVDSDFSKIEKTVARAMEELKNAFGDVINDANQTEQGTAKIADSISGLATTITNNKETISNIFSGIIKGAELSVEGIGNVYRSIQGLAIVAASKDKSLVDWVMGDADTMKDWQKEISNGTAFLKDDLVEIREKISDVQQQWGLWGDKKGKLEALRVEETRILEEIKAIEVAQRTQTKATVEGTEKSVVAVKEFAKIESGISKEKEKQSKEADKRLKEEVKASTKAAKDITDSWEQSYRLREDALEDLEKVENQIIVDREKLAEDVNRDIKRLTMSERDYKIEALEEEYQERVKLAGKDKRLQTDLVEWKKGKIDEIETETGHSLLGMLKNYQDFSDNVGDDFGNFVSDLITGEFDSLGDAWEGLWKSMVGTAAQYLGNIVAEFAAAKIADFATDLFFSHSGTWDVKNDEKRAVLLKGQMVLPEDISEEIRNTFPNPNGDFSGLSEALGIGGGITGSGATGSAIGKAGFKAAVKAGLITAMGYTVDPLGTFGGFTKEASLGAISNALGDMLGFSTETGPFGGSAYSSAGRKVSRTVGVAMLGELGLAMSSLTGKVGSVLGDIMGDALDDRSYESLRDAMEDGIMGPTEAIGFARASDYANVDNRSTLGSARDAISSAIDAAKSAVAGAFGAFGEAMGFGGLESSGGWGSSGNEGSGFGDSGDGMGDMGDSDAGGMDSASGNDNDGYAHTGGYLLKADEGRIIAQTGEGVLSRPGMRNLDKLNTGKTGGLGDDEIKPILLAVALNTAKTAKILQRFEYTGIPVNDTVATASTSSGYMTETMSIIESAYTGIEGYEGAEGYTI